MRLIVINDYGFINGGASKVAISSLNALAEEGVDVTFISSVGPPDKSINKDKIKIINLEFNDLLGGKYKFISAINGLWNFEASKKIREIFYEYNKDDTVVHIHTWVKSLSPSILAELIKHQFKVVITLHDYFTVCPNGGLYNYVTKNHCTYAPMSVSCMLSNCDSRNYLYKIWRVLRHLIQNKCALSKSFTYNFISVSDYSEKLLKKNMEINANFFRVRNPIEIKKNNPVCFASRKEFTYVGRLSQEKGIDCFLSAVKKAKVKSCVIGDGPERDKVINSEHYIKFLGWQNSQGVYEQMRQTLALVFPSLIHETQGLVVAEAAAMGIPAIVSDTCAAQEFVEDGKTGLIFKRGNINDLVDKLNLLSSQPELAYKLGEAAYYKFWTNPPTLENHAKELIKCYREILAK